MSNLFNIHLNKDIVIKTEEIKKEVKKPKRRSIGLMVPESVRDKLIEAKGTDFWVSLLIDGAKFRGVKIDYVPSNSRPRSNYKTHYYCSRCAEWIPHEDGIYKVARAFVRCPLCMLPLRTRGLKSNSKNWTEWDEEK